MVMAGKAVEAMEKPEQSSNSSSSSSSSSSHEAERWNSLDINIMMGRQSICLDDTDPYEERKTIGLFGNIMQVEYFDINNLPSEHLVDNGKKCLLLGHGPSNMASFDKYGNKVCDHIGADNIKKFLLSEEGKDIDLILGCHDYCNMDIVALQLNNLKLLDKFKICTCDSHEEEKKDVETLRDRYPDFKDRFIHFINPSGYNWGWENTFIIPSSGRFYSGLGIIYYSLFKEYRQIYSLGLDWSYCNNSQSAVVSQSFEYFFNRFPNINYHEIIPSSLRIPSTLNELRNQNIRGNSSTN